MSSIPCLIDHNVFSGRLDIQNKELSKTRVNNSKKAHQLVGFGETLRGSKLSNALTLFVGRLPENRQNIDKTLLQTVGEKWSQLINWWAFVYCFNYYQSNATNSLFACHTSDRMLQLALHTNIHSWAVSTIKAIGWLLCGRQMEMPIVTRHMSAQYILVRH